MMNLYEVARFLEAHDNYDILTHAYPDGDTLGSGFALCLALRQIGKKARVITTGVPTKFTYLQKNIEEEDFTTETVVSVDVAADSLLGSNMGKYIGKVDLCIDHHGSNTFTLRKSLLTNMRRQTAKFSTNCSSECTSTLQRTLQTASTQAFQPTPAVSDTQTQPPKPCVLPQVLWTLAVTPHT